MAWQEPKTDWTAADKVNIEDYNRWLENISHLREMAAELSAGFEEVDLGNEKTYSDYVYADEFNQLEESLTYICSKIFPFPIGTQKTYYPNQPTPDYYEINRIESACLVIYNNLSGQTSGKRRLTIRLGGGRF